MGGLDREVYSMALRDALDEILKVCPDIRNIFLFSKEGEIEAGDTETSEVAMFRAVTALRYILESSESAEIENITVEGTDGKITLYCFGKHYLVTITTEHADTKYIGLVTRVLIPTVLRIVERLSPTPIVETEPKQEQTPAAEEALEQAETAETQAPEESSQIFTDEGVEAAEPQETPIVEETRVEELVAVEEALQERPQAVQLMVESISGLFTPADTVRIANDILAEWASIANRKPIETVEIETFDGKTTQCKVKPIKSSMYDGKGVVQIPEKIQRTLKIKSGELVKVRPVI